MELPNDTNVTSVQKRRLVNSLTTVFVLLAVFLAVLTLNAIKASRDIGNSPPANVIAVNGTGEVLAVPDTATFSFSVDEKGKTIAEAQDVASKKVNAILDALKKMGIADKDIQTAGYNSNPTYEYSSSVCSPVAVPSAGGTSVSYAPSYCPPGKQVLIGYEVSQTITVKVRKTADAGTALTTVGSLGATNISGINFVIDDMNAVETQARDKAVADAKSKAAALAKSLGVKLDRIVNFYESGNGPIYYGMAEGKAMDVAAPTVPQIPTGENKITSNVTITYQVE